MIVAVMGGNGAGKTTVCDALVKDLKGQGFRRVVSRKGFDYALLGPLMRRARGADGDGSLDVPGGGRSFARRVRYALWPYAVFFDSLVSALWRRATKREEIVISDRCAYDYLPTFDRLGCGSWLLTKMFLALPRPDVVVILDAPSGVAQSRKGDSRGLTAEEYRDQQQAYLELASRLDIPVIDTTTSPERTLHEVLVHVTEGMRGYGS